MTDVFGTVQRVLFFALLAGATFIFFWMLWGFVLPLLWALIFAVVLYPLYKKLAPYIKWASLRALATILIALLLVFVPLSVLATLVANEAASAYQSTSGSIPTYITSIESIPLVNDAIALSGIDPTELRSRIVDGARTASSWIANEAFALGLRTFGTLVQFVLMLYVLFFLLRDGERLGRYVMRLLPLGDERERLLFDRFATTTRGMFRGSILVALVQGFVGGVIFALVGIPHFVLWGAVMALFALIPAVGPALVWLPAGIILIAMGDVVGGVIVLASGAGIISVIDNVMRPMLAGKGMQMPDVLVLLAVLGGLATFGIAGVVLGPVIAALFLASWSLFEREYKTELEKRG